MRLKAVSGIVLTVLLVGMLTLAFNIQKAKASGTIYIMADGSINPSTVNITSLDNITYTFTGNNYESIVIERDNIVVDGAGYTLQGTVSGIGIDLSQRSNVTITNMEIKAFGGGIYFIWASGSVISGNTITNIDGLGIYCNASGNTISGNNITNNDYGIRLVDSLNSSISGNNITNNEYGIRLWNSSNNKFYHNNFINNTQQVYDFSWDFPFLPPSINTWDDGYPSGGNYWSNYTGIDAWGDGIGDTPYVIDENNTDRYPLMNPWPCQITPLVGGISIPVNKLSLLTPYIALASTIILATVASAVFVKHKKKKQ